MQYQKGSHLRSSFLDGHFLCDKSFFCRTITENVGNAEIPLYARSLLGAASRAQSYGAIRPIPRLLLQRAYRLYGVRSYLLLQDGGAFDHVV